MTRPEDERHTQAEGGRPLPQEGDAHQRPEAPRQSETRRKKEVHSEAEGRAEGNVSERNPSLRLFDLHCHLDFAENARELATGLAQRGIGALSVTVTPAGYVRAAALFAPCANVHTALGLHPWWVADGRCTEDDVAQFEQLAKDARFVGEVGLDFAPAHAASRDVQHRRVRARGPRLRRGRRQGPVAPCGAVGGRGHGRARAHGMHGVVRLRAPLVLRHLRRLHRAVKQGCLFSVNPRMLATKRGRAYVRAIPADRLLLETDLPPESAARYDAADVETPLRATLAELAALRAEDPEALGARIALTSERVLQA